MWTHWNDFGFGDLDRSFARLSELRRGVDRAFGTPFGLDDMARPRVTVHDTGPALFLRAEVPGFAEEDLEVVVENDTLTIRGERKTAAPEGYQARRRERGDLSFARRFTLPVAVDAGAAEAVLKNGVLEMTLPKMPEAQPRKITVRASS